MRIQNVLFVLGILMVFFSVDVAYAAKPASYFGPISQKGIAGHDAGCYEDMNDCANKAFECTNSSSNFYYKNQDTPAKTGTQIDTFCDDWDSTSWDTIKAVFEPCYLYDWVQSTATPQASSEIKYEGFEDLLKEKWRIVNDKYLGADEKITAPMNKNAACQRFFKDNALGSMGSSSFPPVTKKSCSQEIGQCAELYSKCNIADDKNEFKTAKTEICSWTDGSGNFKADFELLNYCKQGLQKFGSGKPSPEYCAEINKYPLGNKCECGGTGTTNSDKGFLKTDGECCLACQTAEVTFSAKKTPCVNNSGLKLADGSKLEVIATGQCVGSDQNLVKYKGKSELTAEDYFCSLCREGKPAGFKPTVKVSGFSSDIVCKNEADVTCADGKKPNGDVDKDDPQLLKKVCTLCSSGSVKIGGATQNCSQEVSLPSINAFPDPFEGSIDSPQALIAQLIKSLLGILGAVALGLIVYGGVIWMTSAGDSGLLEAGRKTLIWAVIGLVAVLTSSVVVSYIFQVLG